MKKISATFIFLFASLHAIAQDVTLIQPDTTISVQASDNKLQSTTKKPNIISRVLNYFKESNKEKRTKKFDISFIGGPHYSTDTKLGFAIVASGLYRTSLTDSLQIPSNVSIYTDVSTVGFYKFGLYGTHIFTGDKQRINYSTSFFSFPSYFWGIGYNMSDDNSNKSKMKRWQYKLQANWLFSPVENLFIGPAIAVNFVTARDVERAQLLNGQRRNTVNFGAGFTMLYDTRDNLTAPHRGLRLELSQIVRPKFIGNYYSFSTTDLHTSGYLPIWRGALLAADFQTLLNFGNPSWGMMALLGNSDIMRGYYEGRYRDKHKMETQLEIRQHIWRRNGIVIWAGAGTVFNKFSAIRMKHILPNYGLGYRWEFKKNVNIRLDYGFGKAGQGGFIFNINEAF